MPDVRNVHADLMRASGGELGFEKRQRRLVARKRALAAEHGDRVASFGVDAHPALAVARRELVQRCADHLPALRPLAAYQYAVALVDAAFAKLRVKTGQRLALFRDHEHAAGVAVESMDELEERRLRALETQPLDQPERDSAATVYGEPGRLVDDEQRVVLVEHRDAQPRRASRRRPRSTRGVAPCADRVARRDPDRRDAQHVADLEPPLRIHAAAVHPDLAAAQDPVDVARRHPLEVAQQEVVDALAGPRLPDGERCCSDVA